MVTVLYGIHGYRTVPDNRSSLAAQGLEGCFLYGSLCTTPSPPLPNHGSRGVGVRGADNHRRNSHQTRSYQAFNGFPEPPITMDNRTVPADFVASIAPISGRREFA